jgi:hypothetical protein
VKVGKATFEVAVVGMKQVVLLSIPFGTPVHWLAIDVMYDGVKPHVALVAILLHVYVIFSVVLYFHFTGY